MSVFRRLTAALLAVGLALWPVATEAQFMLLGVDAAPGALTCGFGGSGGASVSTTSPSVASVPIGTASADRYVVVGINSINNTGTNPISSVTIGGIAATIAVQITPGSSADFNSGASAIAIAAVPTGTTATVAWTVSSASNANTVVAWTITGGLSSTTPTSSATASSGTPEALTLSSVSAGGCAFGVAENNHSGATYTWAQLVSDGNFSTGGQSSGAHKAYATAQASLAVTVTPSTGAGTSSAAAFR